MVLRPQIITERNVLTSLIAPAGARTALMIGTSSWGELNTVTNISNMTDFVQYFGEDVTGDTLTLPKGADIFFNNGGQLKVLRIADGSEAEATIVLDSEVTLTAKYNGTAGNLIQVEVTENSTNAANVDVKITNGTTIEIYNNGGNGYDANADIVSAINTNSALVTAEVTAAGNGLIATSTAAYLTGGLDGASVDIADYTTAFDAYCINEDYNFLLVPGITTDSELQTLATRLENRATTEKRYSRLISGVDENETIATMSARTSSSARLSLVAPSIKYNHRYDKEETVLDGSYLACAYTGMLCNLDLEVSGTHENVTVTGLSVDSTTGQEYYTKQEQENILQNKIIPITRIGTSIQASRAITRYSDTTSVWFEEVVVDIVDFVSAQIETYLQSVIGKPNTADRRAIYASRCDAILQTNTDNGIIQAYQNSLVVEGSSPDTINATISIKPSYNTNFINLSLNIN